jgi:hypothetical protein
MELNRFKQLLESTMGNVKPLISEATEANAGAIQQFLQLNQDNSIVVDYKFGNKTATATANYIARSWNAPAYSGITTVQKLWEVMKGYKNDVGETPGFGPKMAAAVAKVLDQGKAKLDAAAAAAAKPKPAPTPVPKAAPAKTAYQSYAETRPYDIGKI